MSDTTSSLQFDQLYPVKTWLTTILFVGPLVLALTAFAQNTDYLKDSKDVSVIILFIPFGLVLSLPTLIMAVLTYRLGSRHFRSAFVLKSITLLVSLSGVCVTFLILKGSMAPTLMMVYSISVVLSSLPFKVIKSSG